MKFVLAVHGTRGDVEPCATVGVELQRRGHEVAMAVPPNLIDFVESVGLAATPYGPDSGPQIDAASDFLHRLSKFQNPVNMVRKGIELFVEGWAEMSTTLTALARGADLVLTGQTYHGVAVNVAEYHGIPVAGLHHFPVQVNGQLGFPSVPAPAQVIRSTMRMAWWTYGRITKDAEDAQRRALGLPPAEEPALRRMMDARSLEIQGYDHACFPGLAAEWSDRRPFVGPLTLELTSGAEDEVASWIAAGTPPIYFGFGSTPVKSSRETVAMISEACAQLGERALIYSGSAETVSHAEHVKLVGPLNFSTILPQCRAAVHHGGAGTTAAGLRAGLPTLILWDVADQPLWAAAIKRLKVGTARRLTKTSRESLVADIGSILAPRCTARARALATRMTTPGAAAVKAADLLETAASTAKPPLKTAVGR
ncbi:UDP:flavonoid glycosyltransferase YjiC (YdhE family) [Mycobacterium sp. OAS707]|uniref:glycosyltransferase n=1 Tax=Mycobacterium sp. OAS707 TaxID=2663822 RepID=UPI00178AC2B9|nr:glycosyltransferase [Mycobacterium sp. OAS707]MBE1552852.1 UDP:flavonoid glycosyltransferase YjiC (YdhE family) [Mycobacterium sp. OAS707]